MSWVHPQHKRMFAFLVYLGPHPSFSFVFLPHLFKEGDKNTLEQTNKHTAVTSVYTCRHVCIYICIHNNFIVFVIITIIIIIIIIIFFYYYFHGQFKMYGCQI